MKQFLVCAALATGIFAFAESASADCGKVTVAEMNWGSAGIAAQIDKIILETGYGCTVELVPGETVPTFNAMDADGKPDVAPEYWINSVRTRLEKAMAEGRLSLGAEILSDGAVEGWWIPKFVADANPDIKTVQQALAHPELFPAPTNASRAAVYNCPIGWSCQISTTHLFRALGAAEKGFDLIEPPSAEALDQSIADAFAKKTGWLGYYWAPTAFLGKYEMVKLSFGVPHDKADWDTCTALPVCANPKVNSYPISQAFTIVSRDFVAKANVAMDYIKKRKWTNTTVNGLLAWQAENKASNAQAAKYFLKTSPDIWTKWLVPDVATKVRSSL
jgi:glycine betaine/proline transport system substrate-binding protein